MYTNGEKNTKSRSHLSQKGGEEKEGRERGKETEVVNIERLTQPESGEILSR